MIDAAHAIFTSPKVQELITLLSAEIAQAQRRLTSVRPPSTELTEGYKVAIDHLQDIRGRDLIYPYIGSGLGHGPYVELLDGSVKLDLIGGIGVHLYGHGHPGILKASVQAAMQDVVMQGNLQPNREYSELLDLLVKSAGRKSRIRKGWIGTCGTIVNESALKIARQKNAPARKILAMKNAFAGRSTLMAEITDNAEYRQGLPSYGEVLYIPFFDKNQPDSAQNAVDFLKKHIDENRGNISCFVFEFVQGEGGFNTAPRGYFKALFEICRENKIAIWADEVQTFGRTGELFAFETLDLGEYIDIVTLAKTAQVGAVLYTEEYNPKPGLIAGTFTGSTVAMASGLAILKMYLRENGKSLTTKIHGQFVGMLEGLMKGPCKGVIRQIDGLGLMVAMTPYDGSKEKVTALLQRLFKNGLITLGCGHDPYKVRFLLPLVLEQSHIDEARDIIEKSLGQPD